MTINSPTTQQEDIDAMNAQIPSAIGDRISAGADSITSANDAPGLAVGDQAPDFTLNDAIGNAVSLSELRSRGPVVLTFYRGEWCPYCNIQLRHLEQALPSYLALGATLVAISPQSPDHSLSLTEKHELKFPVLSDLDQSVIKAYKLQFTLSGDLEDLQVNVFQNDPATQNADGSRTLPVPATFVVDRQGVIRASFVNADWRVRVDPNDVLEVLESLQ
jgi:peroxiredoxin